MEVPKATYTHAGHKLSITVKGMEAQDVASLVAFAQLPPYPGLGPLLAVRACIATVLRDGSPWTWEAAWMEQAVWQALAMEPDLGPHCSIAVGEVHVGPVAAPLAVVAVQTGLLGCGTLAVHWSDWERDRGPQEGEPGVEGNMEEYAMALGHAVAAVELVGWEHDQGQQGQAQGQQAPAAVEGQGQGQAQGQQALVVIEGQPEQGQGQEQHGQEQGQQGQLLQGQIVRRLPRRLRLVVGAKGERPACPDLEVLRALAGVGRWGALGGRGGRAVERVGEGPGAGFEEGQQEGNGMVVVAEGGGEQPQVQQKAAEGPQEMEVE